METVTNMNPAVENGVITMLTNEENLKNKDVYAHACEVDVKPLAIEPFDKEWGVGLSGNTPEPSPFARINNILKEGHDGICVVLLQSLRFKHLNCNKRTKRISVHSC